ncbi:MAG: methylaspartate mutase accessory protein GlmL [Oscillospiraceae bacterium]|nr:methylaspartate mutase accessory protein GlmL [Oscillospiraceae bacterium]
MQPVLLIDIGSTYTKVLAADMAEPCILGTAAHTTVATDVAIGLEEALLALEAKTGPLSYTARLACSSAAGGLRMVAVGLAPSLTEQAARMACLGAGAKVVRSFAYQLTEEDMAEIAAILPDILLLTGGTDGGNDAVITHNAAMLATCNADFPILLAGNRNATARCRELLKGRTVITTENVMPRLEQLNVAPVQKQVRALFLERIVHAKGLGPVAKQMDGPLIPTPAAVLLATELLAKGTDSQSGFGDLLAIDLGGATTDVYSMARGDPAGGEVVLKGLPEPYAKRTVEGDMGMRYSVSGIVDAVGVPWLSTHSGRSPEQVTAQIAHLAAHPDMLPDTPADLALDQALASAAIMTATRRHAGTTEVVYTIQGPTIAQTGKDLTEVRRLIVTGGAIIHNSGAGQVAKYALFDPKTPQSLRPKTAEIYMDSRYILAAMGLLRQRDPDVALTLMKKELQTLWNCKTNA